MNSSEHRFTNQLIHESSPYLLQHAHNPVDWFPWSQVALDKAKYENKLLIISIGYAACHWCHVMEHESFENEEVASVMNDFFVSIKVDREERPDIDKVYMNAVQQISGNGGWPLNCIALPDGRPIYGGTYFSKESWVDMLKQVLNFVKQNPQKAEQQAMSVTKNLQSLENIYVNKDIAEYTINDLDQIFLNWKKDIDFIEGGHKHAPKFPLPVGYQFLLVYHHISQNENALEAVTISLNKMAWGGIYDQIGGGFARYSVDEYWKVPHFEKMLYDNAQLVSLYSKAYQSTKNPEYQLIISETLDFIQREMTSEDGGFYSALDADSEGEEGKFYIWKKSELKKALGNKTNLIIDYYNITDNGNWENFKNILYKSGTDKLIKEKYKITEKELTEQVLKAKEILLKERKKRIRPRLDDKILTAWNALMLKGYIDAYRALKQKQYLEIAIKNADFINNKLKSKENRLSRSYKNNKASINAFLDDYAFSIEALILLYQTTFDEKFLFEAMELCSYTLKHFYNKNSGMFYYSSDIDPSLITRNMEITDNVIPSSNSVMAKNLFLLGKYFDKDNYINISQKMLNNVKENTIKGGAYYANWGILMSWFVSIPFEVAIVGTEYQTILNKFQNHYLPNVIFSGSKNDGSLPMLKGKYIDGQTTIYVCRNNECKLPVTSIEEVLAILSKR